MRWNSPRFRIIAVYVLASAFLLHPAVAFADEDEPVPPPCSTPEFSQFDFWVGEWDLTWGEDGRGTNVITREYDGCVVRERFETEGFRGMSVSSWYR